MSNKILFSFTILIFDDGIKFFILNEPGTSPTYLIKLFDKFNELIKTHPLGAALTATIFFLESLLIKLLNLNKYFFLNLLSFIILS